MRSDDIEELKPVRCGCGGEAKLYTGKQIVYTGEYLANVRCKKCGIAIPVKVNIVQADAEAEAITAWNTAMGATDICVGDNERTAKVDAGHKSVITGKLMDGHCMQCGRYVMDEDDYCPGCGARLEWE